MNGDLFGTLSVWELTMLLSNVVGLVLAILATGEANMDYSAVSILSGRGLIPAVDVPGRLLKARGSRRDEALKVGIHLTNLTAGIVISASPTPRQEYEAFTAYWTVLAIIVISVILAVGSVYTLIDRRTLWRLFDQEEEDAKLGALPNAPPGSSELPNGDEES